MRYKVLINTINKQIILYDGYDNQLALNVFKEAQFNFKTKKFIECESFDIGKGIEGDTATKYFLATAYITDIVELISDD